MASALASYPEHADMPTRNAAARDGESGARGTQDAALIASGQRLGHAGTTSVQALMGALR